MLPDRRPRARTAEVVVGIAGHGLDGCRSAVRLGAEEARLRRLGLRLVHGSRPAGQEDHLAPSGMEWRQQRGRRLVGGAARDLAVTALGRDLAIWTESSPRTAVDLLTTHARTAVLLVLQRPDGPDDPVGLTIDAVSASAWCPTLVVRSRDRAGAGVGVLVVLDPGHDAGPALVLGATEARLRGTAVTVLDGRECSVADLEAASDGAALMVVVRPGRGAHGPVVDAIDVARCPVLTVAPDDDPGT
ncbi:hypothetical protein [Microlunatus antarcticus]|uniref:Universal stress protein family protein n=1 Tax=Microlunatus antarcticus TaxID=53388 RepID=A0A7W5P754_9ACTN|nr:hypothetical protein [Microlunatus antarcticus]MBB3327229.1 hypothetical protein [Microlunatus antarcticus]